MPYSLEKPDDLPAHVQKLGEADQEKWVAVFNKTYEECDGDDCDAEAMKAANGAVKKEDSVQSFLDKLGEGLRALFGSFPTKPSEPGQRAMAYHDIFGQVLEQGYEQYPSAWLNDVYDDGGSTFAIFTQDGMLYRSPVTIADGKVTLGEWVQVVPEFTEIPNGASPEVKPPPDTMYLSKSGRIRTRTTITRQKDGKVRFLSVSCTAVLNRVGEIDTTELFKDFARNWKKRKAGDPPVLRNFFHLGEVFRTGVVDWVAAEDFCFLTSGIYDDTDIARAEIEAREKNPDYWGDSIEYTPTSEPVLLRVAEGINIPAYTSGIFTGVATLPEDKAAALFTTSYQEVIRKMTPTEKQALIELFGGDEARVNEFMEKNPDALNRMIPTLGVIARANAKPAPSNPVVPEATVPASTPAAPATAATPEAAPAAAPVAREGDESANVVMDEETLDAVSQHILASPQFAALAGMPDALAQLSKTVAELSQNISARAVAQDESTRKLLERIDVLEQDEGERRKTWIQDLPASSRKPKKIVASFRASQARKPESEQEDKPDSEQVASGTLSNFKSSVRV